MPMRDLADLERRIRRLEMGADQSRHKLVVPERTVSVAPPLGAGDVPYVDLTTNQTVGGVKTFTSIPILPDSNPSTDNQAVRKAYLDNLIGALGTWQTYTPVVTSGTGTITSYTSSGIYCVIGGLVFLNFTVKITDKGSGGGTLYVSPPTTTSGVHVGVARENSVNGRLYQILCHDHLMRIFEYAGASNWATGMTFYSNLFYRKGA